MVRTIVLMASALALAAVAGCGGGTSGIPSAESMPSGGSFTGVWHSPQYGEMQMRQSGTTLIGEYTKDERTGRIQGSVTGNLARFEWSEERELIAGHPTTTRGHGYFRYIIGEDEDHYFRGEWGHDDNYTGGGPWNAVRDRRRQPNLSTEQGGSSGDEEEQMESFDEPAGDGGGGSGSSGGDSGGGLGDDLGDL